MTLSKIVSLKYNKTIEKCSNEEIYVALLEMVKDMAKENLCKDT